MVASLLNTIIIFFVSLVISGIIIYIVTRLFGETEGFGTAILTAFIGAIIFALAYYLLGTGWIAAILGGLGWLITIANMYKVGWLKAFFIAIIVWLFAMLVGVFLPTIVGPL